MHASIRNFVIDSCSVLKEYFEQQFSVPLKEGLDIQKMLNGGGLEFEVDVEEMQQQFDDAGAPKVDPEQLYHLSGAALVG